MPPGFIRSVLTSCFLLPIFAATSSGQTEIEYAAIQELRLDYSLSQLIEHADKFSPDLFVEDQNIIKARRDNSNSMFLISLIPTPSYSFSNLDRGWRVALNLSQIISSLTDKKESLSRISDLAEKKDAAIQRLHLKLVKLYQDFQSSRRRIGELEGKIETQKRIQELNGQFHQLGQISDVQMLREEQALADLESSLQSTIDKATQDLTELYFYSGFRIIFDQPPELRGKVLSKKIP